MRFSSPSPRPQTNSGLPDRQPKRSQGSIRPRSPRPSFKRRSPLVLLLLLLLWSVILGIGLAQARTPAALELREPLEPIAISETIAQVPTPAPEGLVDAVSPEQQLGQELYLENCATCHVGLPPAVLPTESWREILTKPYHYGVDITPLAQPALQIAWNYVSLYSRPLQENESTPFRLRSSRYFKILHPKVEFPDRITVRSCVICHPAAEQFNYRHLAPEWENAP